MIELVNPNEVPPGGWRWMHPETGTMIYGGNFDVLIGNIRLFLRNNNFPPIRDLEQMVLEWLDEDIQRKAAAKGLPPVSFIKTEAPPSLAQQARTFAYSMAQWVKAGMKVVPQEILAQRRGLCEACSYWQGDSAYGMGRCRKCGCSGVKLYLVSTRCPLEPPKWRQYNA